MLLSSVTTEPHHTFDNRLAKIVFFSNFSNTEYFFIFTSLQKVIFMKYILSFFLTLYLFNLAVAQNADVSEEELHPIDISLNECLDIEENYSTHGMLNCINEAAKQWDNELNAVYQDLRSRLNEEEKEALRQTQLKWIEFRDAEIAFAGTLYGNMQGTMFILFYSSRRLDIIKDRTIELNGYLSDVKKFREE